jgi:hypothetical protein
LQKKKTFSRAKFSAANPAYGGRAKKARLDGAGELPD